jgi:Tfp pilus assembly protein PilZ
MTPAEAVEKRSEFRFPVAVPVEYFKNNDAAIVSYALDLSKGGIFISSDDPMETGSECTLHLTVPFDYESSRIFRTEGTVAWSKIQPFKSTRNGMGVRFTEPLPEGMLLNALVDKTRKLLKEAEARKALEDRLEHRESELKEAQRLATLGRYAEQILLEVSNPIVTLSGRLELIAQKMDDYKRMLEGHAQTKKELFTGIVAEFDRCRQQIDDILQDYRIVSELTRFIRDKGRSLEKELRKRYEG